MNEQYEVTQVTRGECGHRYIVGETDSCPVCKLNPCVDLLGRLLEWYDSEGKEELSATFSSAWIHGYRTIHKPGTPMLSDLIDEARKLLPEAPTK